MAKIGVSFKRDEQALYEHVKSQLSESVYIKQLIIDDMKRNQKQESIGKSANDNNPSLFSF